MSSKLNEPATLPASSEGVDGVMDVPPIVKSFIRKAKDAMETAKQMLQQDHALIPALEFHVAMIRELENRFPKTRERRSQFRSADRDARLRHMP